MAKAKPFHGNFGILRIVCPMVTNFAIKRMSPDVMRDIELDSISNFKFQPDTGNIVIDEPDKGDYHFHFG